MAIPLLVLLFVLVSPRAQPGLAPVTGPLPTLKIDRIVASTRGIASTTDRSAGSATAAQAADRMRGQFRDLGYEPAVDTFIATNAAGNIVEMQNVQVEVPGTGEPIVFLAHRDNRGGGAGLNDNASGSAVLIELARVVRGLEHRRPIIFISTDGGVDAQAGARRAAATLGAAPPAAVVALDGIGSPSDTIPISARGDGRASGRAGLTSTVARAFAGIQGAGFLEHEPFSRGLFNLVLPRVETRAAAPFVDADVAAVQIGDGGDPADGNDRISPNRLEARAAALLVLLRTLDQGPSPDGVRGVVRVGRRARRLRLAGRVCRCSPSPCRSSHSCCRRSGPARGQAQPSAAARPCGRSAGRRFRSAASPSPSWWPLVPALAHASRGSCRRACPRPRSVLAGLGLAIGIAAAFWLPRSQYPTRVETLSVTSLVSVSALLAAGLLSAAAAGATFVFFLPALHAWALLPFMRVRPSILVIAIWASLALPFFVVGFAQDQAPSDFLHAFATGRLTGRVRTRARTGRWSRTRPQCRCSWGAGCRRFRSSRSGRYRTRRPSDDVNEPDQRSSLDLFDASFN